MSNTYSAPMWRMQRRDWLWMTIAVAVGALALFIGLLV